MVPVPTNMYDVIFHIFYCLHILWGLPWGKRKEKLPISKVPPTPHVSIDMEIDFSLFPRVWEITSLWNLPITLCLAKWKKQTINWMSRRLFDWNIGKSFLWRAKTNFGILLPKLFWPTVRKNCSSDREEFLKFLRSLEQFIQTVKGQNNFW